MRVLFTDKLKERSKKHIEGKVSSSVLHLGDHVLVRNLTPRGGTVKLCNHWVSVAVKLEQGREKSRIVHRNLLLLCDHFS